MGPLARFFKRSLLLSLTEEKNHLKFPAMRSTSPEAIPATTPAASPVSTTVFSRRPLARTGGGEGTRPEAAAEEWARGSAGAAIQSFIGSDMYEE
jgi:hypothetical protein